MESLLWNQQKEQMIVHMVLYYQKGKKKKENKTNIKLNKLHF